MSHSTAAQVFVRRPFRKALIALLVSGFLLGMVIVPIEQASGNIHSIEDGLWWAVTTATGVGYGDLYPVTTFGRLIGAVLQFVGVMTLGVIIGLIGETIDKRQEEMYWAREFERFNFLEKKIEGLEKKLQYLVFDAVGKSAETTPEEAQSNRE